jgi:hypothetical protein
MVNLAYENDPRILAERAKEDAERDAKKQAKKDAKKAKYTNNVAAVVDKEKILKEEKEAADKIKQEETLRKRAAGKLYRLTCKEFSNFCCEKMPGSNYDKYYIEEMVKKFPKQENIEGLFAKVKEFDDEEFGELF